jgi:CRP-like cAMP-binding protein
VNPKVREHFKRVAKTRSTKLFRKFNIPFLKMLSPADYHRLADLAELEEFEPNTPVFEEGSRGEKFYLIVYGRLEVRKQQEEEEQGAIEIEVPLSEEEQEEQNEALHMAAICDELGGSPLLHQGMTCYGEYVLDWLVASKHAEDVEEAMELAQRMLAMGLLVTSDGNLTDDSHVTRSHSTSKDIRLRSAPAMIAKHGRVVARLNAGNYFGEIALVRTSFSCIYTFSPPSPTYLRSSLHTHTCTHTLPLSQVTDVPRTASVMTRTRAIILSISKNSFHTLFSGNPEVTPHSTPPCISSLYGHYQLSSSLSYADSLSASAHTHTHAHSHSQAFAEFSIKLSQANAPLQAILVLLQTPPLTSSDLIPLPSNSWPQPCYDPDLVMTPHA